MKYWWVCFLCGVLLLPVAAAGFASDEDYTEAMAREHAGDTPVPAAAGGAPARQVSGSWVEQDGLRAYLATPADAPRAGLIVIHEWWGLNENIREMSNRLAAEGYLALAVDLYDGEAAADPSRARELMSAAMDDPERIDAQLEAAFRWLHDEGGVASVGTIGWCFGGALSLRTAMMLPEELDAAVIYYGRVVTEPARLAPLMMPILGIFGGQDRGIPVESVLEFETILQTLGKTADIVIYDDADHAFANPSGTRYEPAAAEDAWRRTLEFLAEHL
ncbi:MAG: dienelactone hydrolase family protein [Gammaproteobacteria bacterium]